MKKQYLLLIITVVLILKFKHIRAQDSTYFQQKVDYKIAVELDDELHTLKGNISINYHNNSSDTLSFIYFHLWPNAYKHQQTAFAKQLLQQGRLDFHFSKKKDRGYINNLAFMADGQPISYLEDFLQPDVAKLQLPTVLLPGDSVRIETPFTVKIPDNFSRLAHVSQAYMLCQWYPKPAVYDQNGWHPMSYLDQGEFYSEFGNYDVSISLPSNYVVAATGQLQTPSEHTFLEDKIRASSYLKYDDIVFDKDTFPRSSANYKTIRYTAQNVHDFAWFADKRYWVKKNKITLPSGRKIDSYIMFTKLEADVWKDALKYNKRAIQYYSNIVGEYPYPTVSVVQGDYKGCDMEYPMVTVIGRAGYKAGLDNVITHEIGHNWFYGILGSNERQHPWMDEGWNTYLDARYMTKYYQYNTNTEYLAYLYQAKKQQDQAIETPSDSLSSINYYICGYAKPTLSFRYLEQYIGTEEMDRILKIYYQKWKFKHPSPKDVQAVFEAESTKDISWFFDAIIKTNQQLDFKIKGYSCCQKHGKARIDIQNNGQIKAPFTLSAIDASGEQTETKWIEPIRVGLDTSILIGDVQTAEFRIDAPQNMPEINRNDNRIRTKGLFKKGEPLKFRFLADFRHPEKPRINLLPLLAFNLYDGLMIGGAMYSVPIPQKKWNYTLMPFFSTFSLQPVGMAEFKYHKFIKRHRLTPGIDFKTFHKRLKRFDTTRPYEFADRFYKITPYLELKLAQKSALSTESHSIRFQHSLILEERGIESRVNNGLFSYYEYLGKEISWRSTHRLQYQYKNKQANAPIDVLTTLEYANYQDNTAREHYLKLSVEANFKIKFSALWAVDIRLFAGGFPFHTDRDFGEMPLLLVSNNRGDYHYDEHIMGRREYDNALAQQVSLREGGFKTPIEPVIDDGSSNTFIFAMNLKSDIPIKLPFRTKYLKLKPFLDIGYYKNTAPSVQITSPADEIFVSGGLMLDIWDGAAGVYLPLFGTDNIENKVKSFVGKEFYKRITFSFNLSRFKIEQLADEFVY